MRPDRPRSAASATTRRRRRPLPAPSVLLLAVLGWSQAASAQVDVSPYAGTRATYDSNVFDLPAASTDRPAGSRGVVADLVLRGLLGVEIDAALGSQRLHAILEARRVQFETLHEFDHREYQLDLGLDWRRGKVIEGVLAYRRERRMASFADREVTRLRLETESVAGASAILAIHPEWHLEAAASSRELASPLPEAPRFELDENTVRATLRHAGPAALSVGLTAELLHGRYRGQADAPPFSQQTLAVVVAHAVPGLAGVELTVGRTRRSDGGSAGGDRTEWTGQFDYRRVLTGKAGARLSAFRRLRSDSAGADTVDERGIDAMLDWQATIKTGVGVAYRWTGSRYLPAFRTSSPPDRSDKLQQLGISATWQALPWLALRLSGGYLRRDANLARYRFDGYTTALDVVVRVASH